MTTPDLSTLTFTVDHSLTSYQFADVLATLVPFVDDSPWPEGFSRTTIIARVRDAVRDWGVTGAGMTEDDDWPGAYGSAPAVRAVELIREFLPELDNAHLAEFEQTMREQGKE
jgi:hypothetical protein